MPSTRTWRSSGCQGKSSAHRGLPASSAPLREPVLVKKTKPSSETPLSSTSRADGAPSADDGGDDHRVGLVQPGRERLVVPAPEHRDRVGSQVGLGQPAAGVLLAQLRPPSRARRSIGSTASGPLAAGLRRDRRAASTAYGTMRDMAEDGAGVRGTRGSRGRRRVRDRDRRARQGGLRAALPRRRHRGDRRPGAVRERLGAAHRRHLRARACRRPSPTTSRSTPATSAPTSRPRVAMLAPMLGHAARPTTSPTSRPASTCPGSR